MNIPYAKAGRNALQALYSDTVSSTRLAKVGNVMSKTAVLADVKCHLSVTRENPIEQLGTVAVAEIEYKLFLPPHTDVILGDELTIIRKGQTFSGKAGQPVNGSFSLVVPVTGVTVS